MYELWLLHTAFSLITILTLSLSFSFPSVNSLAFTVNASLKFTVQSPRDNHEALSTDRKTRTVVSTKRSDKENECK